MAVSALLSTRALESRADVPYPSLVVTRGSGAEDCPDTAGVVTRASVMVHVNPFETRPDIPYDTWVQIEFLRVLTGYRAVISARGRRQGTRSIDDIGPGCASLADAVAITLVMMLDPEVARPPIEPTPSDRAPRATPARTETLPPPRLQFGGEASGGAALGVLEHGVPFLEAGLTLRIDRWLGLATGAGFVFSDRAVTPSGSVKLDLWYAYVRAAARVFEHGGTRLALFVGPSIGSLGGQGVGYTVNPDERLWWIAGVLGIEARAALSSSLSWTGRVAALTPLLYQKFYVIDAGQRDTAFRTPNIGGTLSFGILAEP